MAADKYWDEEAVLIKWPEQAHKLMAGYENHARKWQTYYHTAIPRGISRWRLQLYTKKPGGKQFVGRESLPIPPIHEDVLKVVEQRQRVRKYGDWFRSLPQAQRIEEEVRLLKQLGIGERDARAFTAGQIQVITNSAGGYSTYPSPKGREVSTP